MTKKTTQLKNKYQRMSDTSYPKSGTEMDETGNEVARLHHGKESFMYVSEASCNSSV